MNNRDSNRATFVEVFDSIKFKRKTIERPNGHWPPLGFAVNQSSHDGEAASDDYKQPIRSSN